MKSTEDLGEDRGNGGGVEGQLTVGEALHHTVRARALLEIQDRPRATGDWGSLALRLHGATAILTMSCRGTNDSTSADWGKCVMFMKGLF